MDEPLERIMNEGSQAKVARRYRAGLAKRLTRIERGVADLNDAVALLLERQDSDVGAGGDGKRAAEVEGRQC